LKVIKAIIIITTYTGCRTCCRSGCGAQNVSCTNVLYECSSWLTTHTLLYECTWVTNSIHMLYECSSWHLTTYTGCRTCCRSGCGAQNVSCTNVLYEYSSWHRTHTLLYECTWVTNSIHMLYECSSWHLQPV